MKTNPGGVFAYTENEVIFIPEIKLRHLTSTQKAVPLRGYSYVLAVIDQEGNCQGWILKEDANKCQTRLCNPKS